MARAMKDSGIEWIGEIPFAWRVTTLKRLSVIQTGNTPSKDNQDIFYSENEGIPWIKAENLGLGTPIRMTSEYLTPSGREVGRLFPRNTVYVCCIASVGKTGYSDIECSCNQQINGIVFNKNYYWKYGYYMTLAQSVEYINNAGGNVVKIINSDKQAALKCPVPPFDEQQKIADFLDKKSASVDAVIEKTKASIEEYKKLKQAVITQAVTKGIRPNRKMKDSGNIWLGDIPEDWDVKRLKYVFRIRKRIAGKEGFTILSITQKGIVPKDISKNEGQLAENYSNYQLVYPGDFAMNHMDLLTGWVDISQYEGVTSPDYRVFTLENKEINNSMFYLYLMQMCYTNRIFYRLGQGVSGMGRWRLQADKFLNFTIMQPSYDEQCEIANYIKEKCDEIDILIQKKEKALEEMACYKKSLIYEYVTGKKGVPDCY